MTTSLQVTERAAERVRQLITEGETPSASLRVYITGGGCSGFQYGFKLDDQDAIQDDDLSVEVEDITVVVDPMSFQYLMGSEIDFLDDLQGARFIIRNPNASTTCGCGSSFSV
ncbi:MAG: iron-sulfur cluster insertion protein ErpA [Gammaproteobacteria bacterium]|nr:iron-sulfur cluster insertion protein ErpA [Gammaproteobacteria bacterium]